MGSKNSKEFRPLIELNDITTDTPIIDTSDDDNPVCETYTLIDGTTIPLRKYKSIALAITSQNAAILRDSIFRNVSSARVRDIKYMPTNNILASITYLRSDMIFVIDVYYCANPIYNNVHDMIMKMNEYYIRYVTGGVLTVSAKVLLVDKITDIDIIELKILKSNTISIVQLDSIL